MIVGIIIGILLIKLVIPALDLFVTFVSSKEEVLIHKQAIKVSKYDLETAKYQSQMQEYLEEDKEFEVLGFTPSNKIEEDDDE